MNPDPTPPTRDPGLPPANDPGGAHANGYSADPDPDTPPVPDPVPLAEGKGGAIHVPERDPWVAPTGRADPDSSDPEDRAAGVR